MDDRTLSYLIGFGGVFILGVIGFIIAWFLPPDKPSQSTDKRPR